MDGCFFSDLTNLSLSNDIIPVSSSARNLGFIFDSDMSFSDQINSVSKFCHFHIRDIRRIRHLPLSTATALANSLSPANLTTAIHFTLASHKQISTNFNAFKIHWHVSLQILQNINTSHQHSKNYTGFLSNKESISKSVFSHTKHLQINNLHIFTIVFHFRHILFLHDLLIHLFFPFHMSDHHLAKGLSLSSVHDSGIHSLLIPETPLLYQYSVPGSKHTSSKLLSLPIGSFPSPLTVYPDFDSCYSHFMPYRMTPSVRHRAIEVHYYYYYYSQQHQVDNQPFSDIYKMSSPMVMLQMNLISKPGLQFASYFSVVV